MLAWGCSRTGAFFALAVVIGLLASGCADAIPNEPPENSRLSEIETATDCGWMSWADDPLDLTTWFESNPDTGALHWWDAMNGVFRVARRDGAHSGAFDSLRRTMTVWREPVGESLPTTTINWDQVASVVHLKQGMNLVRWSDTRELDVTIREAFRWIGPKIVSITRIDGLTHTCHRDFGDELTDSKDFSTILGARDLLAIELREDATWTQSWMWSPIHASFGTIGADAHTELSEQVREVSGYMAGRYGLGAEPYLVMLLSEVSAISGAYQALTGSEFDVSWWPDDACGVGWTGGLGLLVGCREPIAFDHEYVHVIQHQLARGAVGSSWETKPAWLIEGSAEYIAGRYRDAMDYEDYDDARERAVEVVEDEREEISLSQLETRADFREVDPGFSYALGMLAAEWLAAHAGDEALFEYQRQLSRAGSKWPFAFEIAFGMTVEEFYEAFRQHAVKFEEPRPFVISGILVDRDGDPAPNFRVHAYRWRGRRARSTETDADGRFHIEVRADAYRLAVHSESNCTVYGAYGDGGILASWGEAIDVLVGPGESAELVVRLPDLPARMRGWSTCSEAEGGDAIRGRVLDPDGAGVDNVQVLACGDTGCGRSVTDETGSYSINTPDETVLIIAGPGESYCEWWGARGVDGKLAPIGDRRTVVDVEIRTNRVDLRLPDLPETLEAIEACW